MCLVKSIVSFLERARLHLCAFAPLRETVLCLIVSVIFCNASALADEVKVGPMVPNPAKTIGADQCAKCHQQEVQQWMKTPHFATFDSLHRTPAAKQIADRLGERSIKRSPICTQCHYTEQDEGGRARITAGVSCESCHGGAADWIAIHADFGGEGITRQTETSEHRQQRLKESIARGMNNPHNIYLIARQCYDCHTVPNERLVNEGGHLAGSAEFELVAWSQGMVRHNFVRTGGTANATLTPAELRVMHVVGVMADLEYSLRATAAATQKAAFGVTSATRAARMKRQLYEIQKLVNDPLIQTALDAVATVELRLGNAEAILKSADEVGKAAYEFAAEANGEHLVAIDPLLPTPDKYKN
jgi:hypothetical protein